MQQGTTNDVVKAIVCMITGRLVIGFGMLHSAINAIVIFATMLSGADIAIPSFCSGSASSSSSTCSAFSSSHCSATFARTECFLQ